MAGMQRNALILGFILVALFLLSQPALPKSIISVSSVSYSTGVQSWIVGLVINGDDTINAIDKSQMTYGNLKAEKSVRIGFTNNEVYCNYQLVPRTAIYGGVFGYLAKSESYYTVQAPNPVNKYTVSVQKEVGSGIFQDVVAPKIIQTPPFVPVIVTPGVKISSLGNLIGSAQCPSEADVAIIKDSQDRWKLVSKAAFMDFIAHYDTVSSLLLNPLNFFSALDLWYRTVYSRDIPAPSGFTICAPYTSCPNQVNIQTVNMKYTLFRGSYSTVATAEISKDFAEAIEIVASDGLPTNVAISLSKQTLFQGEYATGQVTFVNGGTTSDAFSVNIGGANLLIQPTNQDTSTVAAGASGSANFQIQNLGSTFSQTSVIATVVSKGTGRFGTISSQPINLVGLGTPTPTGTLTPTATPTINPPAGGGTVFVCPDGEVVADPKSCRSQGFLGGDVLTYILIGAGVLVAYLLFIKKKRK